MRQNSALSLSKSLSKSLFRNLWRVDRAWVIATDRCTSFYSVRNICRRLTSRVVTNPCTSTVSSSMPNGAPLRRISICNNVCYSTIIGLTFTCLVHVPNGHASSISYVVKHLIWIYRTVIFSHLNKIIETTFRFILLSWIQEDYHRYGFIFVVHISISLRIICGQRVQQTVRRAG